jgi:dTDP-4-amino-4,6-dideoxygalactose transaminase
MIRNWQYLPAYEQDRAEILAAVDRVFSSGRLILGQEVETFERDFAAYCGATHGIGVNSGTDALFLALKALGVGTGDEVVTVSNTAVPTVAAIRATGAIPVFVDVEEDSYLMDVTKLEAVLTPQTRCILPVHLCGQPVDMEPLREIAAARSIPVVEDCAQATGARYRDRRVGSIGDIGAFSFYPTKILGAFGDGGMAVTGDPELAARLRRLRFYGMEGAYYAEEEGYNSRLDEVQAALLSYGLGAVDSSVVRRQEIARIYTDALNGVGDIAVPAVREERSHQFYLYTIRTGQRDRLVEHLANNGIEARINYPTPIHLMRGYRFLGLGTGSLPVTEKLAGEILSLPMHPGLSDDEAGQVIDTVRTFFRTGSAQG